MDKKRLILILAVVTIIGLVAYSVCKQRMGTTEEDAPSDAAEDDTQIIET